MSWCLVGSVSCLKKKQNQTQITSWSASLDLHRILLSSWWHPKCCFFFCCVLPPPPAHICRFSANSFYLCPTSWLYLFFPFTRPANLSCLDGASSRSSAVGTWTHCSSDGFLQPACFLLALLCHAGCSQGPAPPLPTDATSVSWGVGLEAGSARNWAEPCSAKYRLFGGCGGRGTECKLLP